MGIFELFKSFLFRVIVGVPLMAIQFIAGAVVVTYYHVKGLFMNKNNRKTFMDSIDKTSAQQLKDLSESIDPTLKAKGKFYNHNLQKEEFLGQLLDSATKVYQENHPEATTLEVRASFYLTFISWFGILDCYNNLEEFLTDFYHDLPWPKEPHRAALLYLLNNDETTDSLNRIKKTWGYNLRSVLWDMQLNGE